MSDIPYYKKELYLASVDESDTITGKVERWRAHTEGILHRGFTAVLTCGDQVLLQHRKHFVFDAVWDLTFSSHPIYIDGRLQSDEDAIMTALRREWIYTDSPSFQTTYLGSVVYEEKDTKSIYIEHEVDRIYRVDVSAFPDHHPEYAYGSMTIPLDAIRSGEFPDGIVFAPWVKKLVSDIQW